MRPPAARSIVPHPHADPTTAKTRFRSRKRKYALIGGINMMCVYSSRPNAKWTRRLSGARNNASERATRIAKHAARAPRVVVDCFTALTNVPVQHFARHDQEAIRDTRKDLLRHLHSPARGEGR